jgi:hypothetical protein
MGDIYLRGSKTNQTVDLDLLCPKIQTAISALTLFSTAVLDQDCLRLHQGQAATVSVTLDNEEQPA